MLPLKISFYIILFLSCCNGLSDPLAEPYQITKDDIQQELSPVDLHNRALKKLQLEDKTLSVILLRKNFYQNLFFPSYLTLKSLKAEVSISPFLWQIGSLFMACFSLILVIFYLKQALRLKRNFKIPVIWFCGLTILFSSGFLNLKKRATNLKELEVLNAPFQEALFLTKIKKGSDLILLKEKDGWLQIKTSLQQKGWVLEKELVKILE